VETYNEKILVIYREIEIAQFLRTRFTTLGYDVLLTLNAKEALIFFTKERFDLVIIDIILSKLDGYEICRKIRESSKVPIILLSALGNIKNRVLGLELGADDYIIKPFSPKELEARVKSVLRRHNNYSQISVRKKEKILEIGSLIIDLNTKIVSKNGVEVKLTIIEYNILKLLINNAGKQLSRATILDNVWGYAPQRIVDTRIVDVHIARLRSKIEDDTSNPDLITTVRGRGYIFLNNLSRF
jgi:OmpR family response regulator RpaB